MDPISVLTTVKSVLEVTTAVIGGIKKYVNASALVAELGEDCGTMQLCLESSRIILAREKSSGAQSQLRNHLIKSFNDTAKSTRLLLSDFLDELGKLNPSSSKRSKIGTFTKKLEILWRDDYLKETRDEIRRQYTLAREILGILNTDATQATNSAVVRIEQAVESIHSKVALLAIHQDRSPGRSPSPISHGSLTSPTWSPSSPSSYPSTPTAAAPRKAVYSSTELGSLVQAERVDISAVEKLLARGADPNMIINDNQHAPLHFAAWHGQTELISMLLAYGASTTQQTKQNKSIPILHAIQQKNEDAVFTLAAQMDKDQLGVADTEGLSAIHTAAKGRMPAAIVAILERSVDPNLRTTSPGRETPLHIVLGQSFEPDDSFQRTLETAKLLLESGADPTLTNTAGKAVLHVVAEALPSPQKTDMLALLAKHAPALDVALGSEAHSIRTPLYLAASSRDTAAVKLLLDLGASPNPPDGIHYDGSAVMTAIFNKDLEVLRLLLAGGANPDISYSDNRALTRVCGVLESHKNSPDILWPVEYVELLLKHGADPNGGVVANENDDKLSTPLRRAVLSKNIKATHLLLGAKANPNIRFKGFTLLREVCAKDSKELSIDLIALLLEHGANPTLPSPGARNETPLHGLTSGKYPDGSDLMRVARLLLEHGTKESINTCCDDGHTALTRAARYRDARFVHLLLKSGADVTVATRTSKSTAMVYACAAGNLAIVLLLMGAGASVNRFAELGTPPLHAAAYEGKLETIRFLLDSEADVTAIDSGWNLQNGSHHDGTAASLARAKGYVECAELIEGWDATMKGKRMVWHITGEVRASASHKKEKTESGAGSEPAEKMAPEAVNRTPGTHTPATGAFANAETASVAVSRVDSNSTPVSSGRKVSRSLQPRMIDRVAAIRSRAQQKSSP